MQRDIQSVPISKRMFAKASDMKIPLSGTFELSPVCNFSCKMCYVRKSKKEVAEHQRPMLDVKHWLQIARDARDAGLVFLLLTGGEPFLWPGFWEFYEELVKMGLLISINTNGSLIDDEVIERLKMHPPKRINITLYGASDESYEALCGVTGVFKKVDNAIKKLKAEGIEVKLNSSLTPSNQNDMEAIISYAKENELILEMASYMFPPIRRDREKIGENHRFTSEEYAKYRLSSYHLIHGKEKYEELLERIRKRAVPPLGLDESCKDPLDGKVRCRAGKAAFWITWDGYMTPCGMMPEPRIDLYKTDFIDAWKEIVKMTEKISASGTCESCLNRQLCHTCPAIALSETGTTEGIPIYLCKMVEELQRIAERTSREKEKEK